MKRSIYCDQTVALKPQRKKKSGSRSDAKHNLRIKTPIDKNCSQETHKQLYRWVELLEVSIFESLFTSSPCACAYQKVLERFYFLPSSSSGYISARDQNQKFQIWKKWGRKPQTFIGPRRWLGKDANVEIQHTHTHHQFLLLAHQTTTTTADGWEPVLQALNWKCTNPQRNARHPSTHTHQTRADRAVPFATSLSSPPLHTTWTHHATGSWKPYARTKETKQKKKHGRTTQC